MGYIPPASPVCKPFVWKPIRCNRMVVAPFQVKSVATKKLYSRVPKWELSARVCAAHCITEARQSMPDDFSTTLWMGRDWTKGYSIFEPTPHNGIILLYAFRHNKNKLYKSKRSVANHTVSIGFEPSKAVFNVWLTHSPVFDKHGNGHLPREEFSTFELADPDCTTKMTGCLQEYFKSLVVK